MNIIEYLEAKGVELKSCSSHVSEYMGACPFCGGDDRFRVWLDEGNNNLGRWACRKGEGYHPGKTAKEFSYCGDLLDLVMALENVSYSRAKEIIGLNDDNTTFTCLPKPRKSIYSEEKEVNKSWVSSAKILVSNASSRLLNETSSTAWNGGTCLNWLINERCLSLETIKKFQLGLITEYMEEKLDLWGLEPYTDTKGKEKDSLVFFRQNLIIPTWRRGGYIDRIKVRFPKPTANNQRFTTVRGSNDSPAPYGKPSRVYAIVESELDAILLTQEAPQVCPICLGGAGKYPTESLAKEIKEGEVCLVCLDSDKAGEKKLSYWLDNFSNAIPCRIPPQYGKDFTELEYNYRNKKSPINLAFFIDTSLSIAREKLSKKPKPKPAEEPKPIAPLAWDAVIGSEEVIFQEEAKPLSKEEIQNILINAINIADSLSPGDRNELSKLFDSFNENENTNPEALPPIIDKIKTLTERKEI